MRTPTTTGPRSGGSRFASPPRAWRRAPRSRNSRPAKRFAGSKTASRKNFSRPSILRPELFPQVTETHQESVTYVFDFAPGCAVAPNNAWTDQDRTAAKYASDVYGDNTGGLLNKFGIPYDPKNGFAAGLYLGPDGNYYLAMRGTQPTSGANWWANLKQAFGFKSSQYEQAVNLARAADRAIGAIGGDLIIVGHSLGGGLASAGSYATGRDAITFNAAGLSSRYATGDPGDIRAHYIQGDILSMAQDYTPFFMPSAAGTRIPHDAAHWYEDPLSRHLMSNFLGL
jgi:hypothetical protein